MACSLSERTYWNQRRRGFQAELPKRNQFVNRPSGENRKQEHSGTKSRWAKYRRLLQGTLGDQERFDDFSSHRISVVSRAGHGGRYCHLLAPFGTEHRTEFHCLRVTGIAFHPPRIPYRNGLGMRESVRPYFPSNWDSNAFGYRDLHPPLDRFVEVARSVESHLFSMDVAKRRDGDWMIVELGDGQVAVGLCARPQRPCTGPPTNDHRSRRNGRLLGLG